MGKHRNGNDNPDGHWATRRVRQQISVLAAPASRALTHTPSRAGGYTRWWGLTWWWRGLTGWQPLSQLSVVPGDTGTELILRAEGSAPNSLPTSRGSRVHSEMSVQRGQHAYEGRRAERVVAHKPPSWLRSYSLFRASSNQCLSSDGKHLATRDFPLKY